MAQEQDNQKKKKGSGGKVAAGGVAVAALAALALFANHNGFFGDGFGLPTGGEQGSSVTEQTDSSQESESAETSAPEEQSSAPETEAPADSAASAVSDADTSAVSEDIPEEPTGNIAAVTVNESEILYENRAWELDDLIAELKKIEGGVTVVITDSAATLKTYEDLEAKLKENSIPFVESNE